MRRYLHIPTARSRQEVLSIQDRKQTRRRAFAEEHCVVAILGDEKADFDELYQYLRSPDDAVTLERLVGDRWFLAPTPLD